MSESGRGSEARSGSRQSVGGLVGALAVVSLLIGSIWSLSLLHGRPTAQHAEAIDYSSELAEARSQAPFDVFAPSETPSGWAATSATWRGAGPEVSWHLGFRTGDGEYVGLEQGNQPAAQFIAARTLADQPAEPALVAGRTWTALTSTDGHENAFVLVDEGITTVVTGTAPVADLLTFTASLRAAG